MPRPRFDKLDPGKREALLAAAANEFAGRGYEAASVNRIASGAGTSKGALYYYFEDKADLFATVLEAAMGRVLAEVSWPPAEELTAENFWAVARQATQRSLPALHRDTWYMRILWSFYRLQEEAGARAASGRVMQHGRELTRSFFRRGQELGVVRTDLPLELLVEMHLAADMAGDRWLVTHWDEFDEAVQAELMVARVNLVQDMLAPSGGRRGL